MEQALTRPRPLVQVDADGVVLDCTDAALVLLGCAPGTDLAGQLLVDCFDRPTRGWLSRLLHLGGAGVEERTARTLGGRALRIRPLDHEGSLELLDDTGFAAVLGEREVLTRETARSDLAVSVARELNDPMSIVLGRLELLVELGEGEQSFARHVSIALEHARRVSSTLHLLRLVGRPPPQELGVLDLGPSLQRAARLVGDVELHMALEPPDLQAAADPDRVEQVLVALLVRLSEDRGLGIHVRGAARAHGVEIVLESACPARSQADLPIAMPGDPRLDVGVAREVIERIGGELDGWRVGPGLRFRLRLPRAEPARTRALPAERSVLVVGLGDGDAPIATLLGHEGFTIDIVAGGEQALALLACQPVDAVVTALDLPGLSGITLVREIRERWPQLQDRLVVVCRQVPADLPANVVALRQPVERAALLRGLGRRDRRTRRTAR